MINVSTIVAPGKLGASQQERNDFLNSCVVYRCGAWKVVIRLALDRDR